MWTKDAKGRYTYYNYDSRGNMTYMKDAEGNETFYTYDSNGYLVSQTQCGVTTTYTNDAMGNRLTETKPAPANIGGTVTTKYEYDANGRLVKTIYPDETFTETVYDSLGKPIVRIDAKGRETETLYDEMGRQWKVTYPDGNYEITEYDAEGRRIKVTQYYSDMSMRETRYEYDDMGRQTRVIYPDGLSSITHYDSQGRVDYEIDEQGVRTSYGYDLAGRRISMTRGNITTTYGYDENGNQTSITDNKGRTTYTDYDELNRAWRVRYPNGTSKTFEYDKLGRKVAEVDEAGKRTEYGYDCLGHLISVRDAMNNETRYEYDVAGNLVKQIDALGRETRYEYDEMNRRKKRILPGGQEEEYGYDEVGNMVRKRNFNGQMITYTYHTATDRLLSKVVPGYGTVTYSYDSKGRRQSMTDASGMTTYSYDIRDRLVRKTTPFGALTYTYTNGLLTGIMSSNENGVSITYSYDSLSRLQSVTDNRIGKTTTYSYDENSNLETCIYPNGIKQRWEYDENNRLTNLRISGIGDVTLKSFAYTLGLTGNRVRVVENSRRTVEWSYDDLYRLTRETVTNSTTSPNYSAGYSYDAVGNRQSRIVTPEGILPQMPDQDFTGDYDENDRLLEGYGYNNNGATVSAPDGWAYTYDAENHLLTAEKGGNTISYVYDGEGNRVSKTLFDGTNTVITRYLTDSENPTGYVQVVEELNGAYGVQKRYVYGLDLISQTEVGTGSTQYYIYDGTGSTRMLTDEIGNVVAKYDYDAFGTVIYQTGTTGNNYHFHGEQYDEDLGLYYLRARWMNGGIGRFVSMDEWEGNEYNPITLNKYLSFEANPVNNIDPLGYWSIGNMMMTVSVIGILSNNVYAILPSELGEAWVHKTDKWTDADIELYRSWIKDNYRSYIGRELECSKLATTMLIDFASEKGLPVHLNSWYKEPNNPTPHYSDRTRYRNKERFLRMANAYISAEGIWLLNTYEKGKILDIPNIAQTGDLIMHVHRGVGYTGHTMIFINYSAHLIKWIQGTQPPYVDVMEKDFTTFINEKKPESLRFWSNSVLLRNRRIQ